MAGITFNSTADGVQIWAAKSATDAKARYVLVFNLLNDARSIHYPWTAAGIGSEDKVAQATEMWSQHLLGNVNDLIVNVNGTGVASLRVQLA
jgi:hypothetical protein